MEARVNAKVQQYVIDFKHALATKLGSDDVFSKQEILQFIYDYELISLDKTDFAKRTRVKNIVPLHERCKARRAEGGEQCTRKRRDGCLFCGTHMKGTPHGIVEDGSDNELGHTQIEVVAKEIKGIIYYVDQNHNVYKTEDVVQNRTNPKIVAKYAVLADGSLCIPEFEL